jgi:hypothetical protein
MSVRATNSLISDIVTVSGIPNSPKMVVLAVEEEKKQVTAVWFSSSGKAQTAVFPAPALDRVEVKASASKAAGTSSAAKGKGKKK